MGSTTDKAFESLGPFPIVQAGVALLILAIAIALIWRASRDKQVAPTIPAHFLMGPLHDCFENIRDLAEQSRQQTEILRRIDGHVDGLVRQTEITKATLETIRNESRLR